MPVYRPWTNPETGKREMQEVVIPPLVDDGFTDCTSVIQDAFCPKQTAEEFSKHLPEEYVRSLIEVYGPESDRILRDLIQDMRPISASMPWDKMQI